MSIGGDFLSDIRASLLPVELVLGFCLAPRPFVPGRPRGRGEPGQLARGGVDAVQALAVAALSGLCEPRFQVQDERAHDGGAGADDAKVDFQDAGQSIADADPGVVVGENLPGVRGADDADGAGDDAEAHEEVEGDFGTEFEAGVPEEENGEGGADEVCYYGEDCGQSVIVLPHRFLTDILSSSGVSGLGVTSPP